MQRDVAAERMLIFRRNAMRLARGTVGGQIIVLLAAPLLARLYSPADFGQLAVFTSLLVILANVSALKLEQAVLLPKTEFGARQITRLILVIASAFCVLALAVIGVLRLIDSARFGSYLLLVPVAILATIFQNIGQAWCSRQQTFGFFGVSAIVNAVVNVAFCLVLAIGGASGLKLALGYTLGLIAAAIYFCYRKWRVTVRILYERWDGLSCTLKDYRNFPLHVLPSALLSSFAYQAMPLLITYFFDASVAGNYAIANRLLVLPSVLIGAAVSEVFKSEFVARMHRAGGHGQFFLAILARIAVIALLAYSAIWLVSPFLFRIVFGEKFAQAGYFAQYLCLGVGATFVMQPFTYVFIALTKTAQGLVLQTVLAFLPLFAFMLGALEHDIARALLYSSAATFLCMLLYLGFAFWFVRANSPKGGWP